MQAEYGINDVTGLYDFRAKIWSCSSVDEAVRVAAQYGLVIPIEITELREAKKCVLNLYFEQHLQHGRNSNEQFRLLLSIIGRIGEYFKENSSTSSLLFAGTVANGKPNGRYSDADLICFVGNGINESEIVRGLSKAGLIITPEMEANIVDDIQHLQSLGGLARLCTLSNEGVEVEFHLLAEGDARAIPMSSPGSIQRVRAVSPKPEIYTSFTGHRYTLPKPSTHVPHFLKHNSLVLKGFFPDTLLISEITYDPTRLAEGVLSNLWYSVVKAFMYHNGSIKKHNDSIVVEQGYTDFQDFLKTLFYNNVNSFSQSKLLDLESRFNQARSQIVSKLSKNK